MCKLFFKPNDFKTIAVRTFFPAPLELNDYYYYYIKNKYRIIVYNIGYYIFRSYKMF